MIIVLFDSGAELIAKKNDVSNVFNSRKKDLMSSKPILVISHWDIDHIHCLKSLTIQDIKDCFSCIICNDQLKTITSKMILCNFCFALSKKNVFCLSCPPKTDGIKMHLWKKSKFISLYLGEKNSNINYSGLLMFVRGNYKSANYTGDCRLSQANYAYDQEKKGLKTNEHILIAPHHGGNFSNKHRVYSMPCNEVEISVGNNPIYHHPNKNMVNFYNKLGIVEQTNIIGDIIKDL
jgi:beta-lactamase superfamily II metal-dependent hydrolase